MPYEEIRHTALKRRISSALEKTGMSRADLIAALDQRGAAVSHATISQWVNGLKRPDRDKMPVLADVLRVPVDWLEKGTGEMGRKDMAALRQQYRAECRWQFRAAPLDQGHDYGNPNLYAFKPGIGALVRDATQNINDALLSRTDGAAITFRLHRLEGMALREYQKAIGWDSLRAHIEASNAKETKLTRVLKSGLQELDQNEQLILLTIEDRRTLGLNGPETGQGNFAALCRNNLDSNKGATAGGSYGLGKAVYTLHSQFATTLYHSDLSQPLDENGERRDKGRVIGRTDLQWHTLDNQHYAGPGWFGQNNGGRAVSVWGNDALIHDLYLARVDDDEDADASEPHDDTGTSIQIVGFYDPSGETPSDIQKLGSRIEQELCRHFWPALTSGRLEANIVLYENRKLISRRTVEAASQCEALVEAYQRRNQGLTKPKNPGEVATVSIPLIIPALRGQKNSGDTHEAQLIVRLDTPEDAGSDYRARLAVFRGNEMVVQYRPLQYHMAAGSRPFHAILCCGTAAGDTEADRRAEEFLRTAEPPAHDRWESNQDVTAQYMRGGGKAISDFLDAAAKQVRELLRPPQNTSEEGPLYMRELLRVAGGGGGGDKPPKPLAPKQPYLTGSVRGETDNQGRWVVEAEIKIPDGRHWRVVPGLLFDAESGPDVRGEWQLIEPLEGCTKESEGSNALIAAPSRRIRFRAVSNPASHPAPASETAIRVVLSETEAVVMKNTPAANAGAGGE